VKRKKNKLKNRPFSRRRGACRCSRKKVRAKKGRAVKLVRKKGAESGIDDFFGLLLIGPVTKSGEGVTPEGKGKMFEKFSEKVKERARHPDISGRPWAHHQKRVKKKKIGKKAKCLSRNRRKRPMRRRPEIIATAGWREL